MSTVRKDKTQKEYDEVLLEVRRVTRVTTGGRRMSFRATVLAGNRKGKIGLGIAKGADVSIAVKKASHEAYKNMFTVPLTRAHTVPYFTTYKYKSCVVKLIPASAGTGLKAWSAVRSVLELAGYENMLSKIIGSNNKLNNALATLKALTAYKHANHFSGLLDASTKKNTDTVENTQETSSNTKVSTKKDTTENTTQEVVEQTTKTASTEEKKAPAKKIVATKTAAPKKPEAKTTTTKKPAPAKTTKK